MAKVNEVIEHHLNSIKVGLDRVHFIQNGLVDQCAEVFNFLKNTEEATAAEREQHLKRARLSLDSIKQTEKFITHLHLELESWHLQKQSKKN